MRFIETAVFTRAITELMDDEDFQALQLALFLRPELGATIRGGGGLRKARWALPGMGKRGGVRVIYHWDEPSETFFMLYAYPKSARDDLTAAQLRALARIVRKE